MTKHFLYPGLLMGTTILFSCQKAVIGNEDVTYKFSKQKKNSCIIASLAYSTPASSQTVFRAYSNAGGVFQVDAGIFSGGAINSSISLKINYSGENIYFTKTGTPADTVLIASLNTSGRVEKVVAGNSPDAQFLPTSFDYIDNNVSAMHILIAGKAESSIFKYDSKGNNTSIEDLPSAGVSVPGKVIYEYSNKKISQQFYLDEPRRFSWNTFTLLQYLGLFPELNPAHIRTATKVWWGNNYLAYNAKIQNQVLDNDGKLLKYDVIHPQTGSTISSYAINWWCNDKADTN